MTKKILIIEDDPNILAILKIIFTDEGFQTVINSTGTTLDEVNIIHPDLILMDIRIVGSPKSGAEICRELKAASETGQIPVVLLSAEYDLAMIASECKADDFINKPFDIGTLVNRVNKLLHSTN